jgi:hypothetical protein
MCGNGYEKYSEKVDERHHASIEDSSDEKYHDESSSITRASEFFYDFSSSIGDFLELFKESFSLQCDIFFES